MELILTNTGSDLASIGFVTGQYPKIAKVKLGDGGGVAIEHTVDSKDIVNPIYETRVVAGIRERDEVIIVFTVPVEVGGFTVREVGCYTEEDQLVAVSKSVNWVKATYDEDPTELVVHMKLTISASQKVDIVFSEDDIYASQKALAETNRNLIMIAKHIREELAAYKEEVRVGFVNDTHNPSVTGMITTDTTTGRLSMVDTDLVSTLGLDVGDVIRITPTSPDLILNKQMVENNLTLPIRHMCEHRGDIYAVVHEGTEDTRGLWKQTNGKDVFKRVLDEYMVMPSITSDGTHLYLSKANSKIRKVERLVLVEGKDPEPVLDADGNPTYEQIPVLDDEGNPTYEQIPVLDDEGNPVYEQIPVLDDEGNPTYEQIPVTDILGNPVYEQIPVLDDEGNPTYEQIPVLDAEGNPTYEQIPRKDINGDIVFKYTQLMSGITPIQGTVKIIDGTHEDHPDYPDSEYNTRTIIESPQLVNNGVNLINWMMPDGSVEEIKVEYVSGVGYVKDDTYSKILPNEDMPILYNYEPVMIEDLGYSTTYRYSIVSKATIYDNGDQIFKNGDQIFIDGEQLTRDDLDSPITIDGDQMFMDGKQIFMDGDQLFYPAIAEVLSEDPDFNRITELTKVNRQISSIHYNKVDGNLYMSIYNGYIMRVGMDGVEVAITITVRPWSSITSNPYTGDMYGAVMGGSIYKRFGADFVEEVSGVYKTNQLFFIGDSLCGAMVGGSPLRFILSNKTTSMLAGIDSEDIPWVGAGSVLNDTIYLSSTSTIYNSKLGNTSITRTVSVTEASTNVLYNNGMIMTLPQDSVIIAIESSENNGGGSLKIPSYPTPIEAKIERIHKGYMFASKDDTLAGYIDYKVVTPYSLSDLIKELKKVAHESVVPGEYRDFAMPNPKGRWLFCDGRALSRAGYPELFAAIGTSYGKGDGVNTFNIPDRRGLFPRCLDAGKGIDPDKNRTLASVQGDAIRNITGNTFAHNTWPGLVKFTQGGVFRAIYYGGGFNVKSGGGDTGHYLRFDASRVVPVAPENRPINAPVYTCIAY